MLFNGSSPRLKATRNTSQITLASGSMLLPSKHRVGPGNGPVSEWVGLERIRYGT